MSAKTVISTLQQIALRAVDKAAEQLTASNKIVAEERGKLSMLEKYRDEYLNKFSLQLEIGVDMQMHQNYQRFMQMLDNAISGQEQVLENARAQVLIDQQAWQESNKKKFSYEVLGDRFQKKADRIEDRKDQKLMDEFAMRGRKLRMA